MALNIDKEFESLIDPLLDKEIANLEESLLKEGCRDQIIAWNDTILDGHHRYRLCTKHDIEFSVLQLDFDTREDAMVWMVDNQLSRRNLSDASRIVLVSKKKDLVAARAKENQSKAGGDRKTASGQMARSDIDPIATREVLAKEADSSPRTVARVLRVEATGTEELKKAYKKPKSDISISLAEEISKMEDHQQVEVVKRVEEGQKSTEAYREVLFKDRPRGEQRPMPTEGNFERLANICMSFADGLQAWAEGTMIPQTEREAREAKTLRDSAPIIIAHYYRLGVDIDWCLGVAKGEKNGRITRDPGQEAEGERIRGDEVIDVSPD